MFFECLIFTATFYKYAVVFFNSKDHSQSGRNYYISTLLNNNNNKK